MLTRNLSTLNKDIMEITETDNEGDDLTAEEEVVVDLIKSLTCRRLHASGAIRMVTLHPVVQIIYSNYKKRMRTKKKKYMKQTN